MAFFFFGLNQNKLMLYDAIWCVTFKMMCDGGLPVMECAIKVKKKKTHSYIV